MIRRSLIITAAFMAAVIPFLTPSAYAATNVKSITLSPASTSLTLVPGTAANRNISVINDGDVPYSVDLSVEPYRVKNETYDPLFTRLPGTTDASQWVALSQKSLTLSPHQTIEVPYTAVAPKATAAGGYYAVIFAETTTSGDGGVSARNRVGDILYMTVEGAISEGGSASDGGTAGFTFGTQTSLGTKVTNVGGTHFQTDTRFVVKSLTGKTVLDTTSTHYVLPQTTRLITQDFAPGGIGGIYNVSRSATINGDVKTVPDKWIVIVKPQLVPLVIFALLTVIGFFILLRRTRHPKR